MNDKDKSKSEPFYKETPLPESTEKPSLDGLWIVRGSKTYEELVNESSFMNRIKTFFKKFIKSSCS